MCGYNPFCVSQTFTVVSDDADNTKNKFLDLICK